MLFANNKIASTDGTANDNPLQNQVQKLLDKENDNVKFRLDIEKEMIRQTIGEAFVDEPGLKWSMNHFDRTQVLKTHEELVHFSRFANSYSLLEDLDAPSHFQLCQVSTDSKDSQVGVVSCASLKSCHPSPPRGPIWFRRLQSSMKMIIDTIRIIYRFGDSLPSVFYSPCMSRLQEKTQRMVDEVDEWHHKYGPSRPHWVLHLIGIHPTYKGQGKGKIIMNKICSLADQLDQDIYLEACGSFLKGYYERYGFVVKGVETLVDPKDPSSTIDVHLVRESSK